MKPRPYMTVMVGYYYQMTPVPAQVSESNLIDNNKHGVSVGWEIHFQDLPVSWRFPLTLSIHGQVQILQARLTVKDLSRLTDSEPLMTGLQIDNPGYPRFRSGGYLINIGMSVSYAF